MKKFTLFAVAALSAATALAAGPAKVQQAPQARMSTSKAVKVANLTQARRADAAPIAKASVIRRAEGETPSVSDTTTVISNETAYQMTQQSFYLGGSANGSYWRSGIGFAGNRNSMGFLNLQPDAASNSWVAEEAVGVNEDRTDYIYEPITADTKNFIIDLKPDMMFKAPVLTSSFDLGENATYTPDKVVRFFCGGSPYYWGYYAGDDEAEEIDPADMAGVSVAGVNVNDPTWVDCLAYALPDANEAFKDRFDANGTSTDWLESVFESDETVTFSNVKVEGFTTLIPAQASPYQLGATWMWFMCASDSAFTLTATVYPLNEEGIDYESPIARGEATVDPADMGWPVINFLSLDEEGYETEIYPCIVNEPVAVVYTGFNVPGVKYFIPYSYENTTFPASSDSGVNYRQMYPQHSYVNLSYEMTGMQDGELTTITGSTEQSCPYYYYSDATRQDLLTFSDFCTFFNVEFPTVMNATDPESEDYGTANFSMTFEAAGGQQTADVVSDYNIEALIANDVMTVTTSGDWLSFAVTFVAGTETSDPYSQVTVTAEALPEGETGREGWVLFEGNACDFYIAVTQGEVGAIDAIEVAPKSATRLYDLQGRRLSAAPAKGLYIESNGVKHIAR